jgi:hypothetical protein
VVVARDGMWGSGSLFLVVRRSIRKLEGFVSHFPMEEMFCILLLLGTSTSYTVNAVNARKSVHSHCPIHMPCHDTTASSPPLPASLVEVAALPFALQALVKLAL